MGAERINQEGRILGALPVVTNAILFNTSNADAVVSAMQILPITNAWNEDISRRPLLVNSDEMIAQISADLSGSRQTLRVFQEMNYVLTPDSQPLAPINFVNYPDESDLNGGVSPTGLYPIPSNLPIETWPTQTGALTLSQWQQDVNNTGGDRHAIIVQPNAGLSWEMWQTKLTGTNWQSSNGARFDLNTGALRPAGWTSGDAAGLPMFPALVRYDECERGMVEHACRIVVARSRKEYLYPATHFASTTSATQTNVPAMGQRLRLKSSFVIPGNWAIEEQALLRGLKKYGALVADNGGFLSISITPDDRYPANAFSHIATIGITNFEVIQGTGANEGPRSPGGPGASAGADQWVALVQPAALQGFVNYTGAPPIIQWYAYLGPGTVTFGDASQTNTTASFSAPGVYTLRLSADDGVHAVGYDAVVITVSNAISVSLTRNGPNVNLSWNGGSPPFVVEQTANLAPSAWNDVVTTNLPSATLPITVTNAFFRVRGN
jgi:hypothetical protein